MKINSKIERINSIHEKQKKFQISIDETEILKEKFDKNTLDQIPMKTLSIISFVNYYSRNT